MKEAKTLSKQGKQFMRERNAWSAKAAEKTCLQMNSENSSYVPLDLHGLRVQEAIQVLDQLITSLKRVPGKNILCLITGRGRRSQGGVSKLKPAIESYLKERSVHFQVPDNNDGQYQIFLESKGSKYLRKA